MLLNRHSDPGPLPASLNRHLDSQAPRLPLPLPRARRRSTRVHGSKTGPSKASRTSAFPSTTNGATPVPSSPFPQLLIGSYPWTGSRNMPTFGWRPDGCESIADAGSIDVWLLPSSCSCDLTLARSASIGNDEPAVIFRNNCSCSLSPDLRACLFPRPSS